MIIAIINEIYDDDGSSRIMNLAIAALILSASILIGITLGSFNSANAVNISKKSSTNCQGNHCQTIACINNKCQTSFSIVNSTRELLNSTFH